MAEGQRDNVCKGMEVDVGPLCQVSNAKTPMGSLCQCKTRTRV
jgi:hypothetical protein